MFNFLRSMQAKVVTAILLILCVTFYAYPKNESVPLGRPLKDVPKQIGDWRMTDESQIDTEVQELLKADETLSRIYVTPGTMASLFIAFFKTQRTGVTPHSPKVCLPGSGWTPTESTHRQIAVRNWNGPITVNEYIVSRGEQSSLVLYWYQTHNRVIPNEYAAKVYTVLDGLRYHRSDTSLVRVIVPFAQGGAEAAREKAQKFVQDSFPVLKTYLPA